MHAFLIDGLLKLPRTVAVVRKLTDAQVMKLVMAPFAFGFAH